MDRNMNLEPLLTLLSGNSVDAIGTAEKDVITEKSSNNLSQLFSDLTSHRIHSLPVLNESGTYTSFVDIWDLVHHLVGSFTDDELKKSNIPKLMEWRGEYVRVLDEKQKLWEAPPLPEESKADAFRNTTVGQISSQPFFSLSVDKNLLDVVQLMASKKVHRVAIVDKDGGLKKIISQMDLIRWLDQNLDAIGLSSITLSTLELDTNRNVHSIDINSTALEAFRVISDKKVSGIPVVDSKGVLVGNVSTSDLRIVIQSPDEFLHLFLSMSDYLKKVHQRDTHVPDSDVTCTRDTTLKALFKLYIRYGIHRVYLTSADHHVEGVVTVTDVISSLGKALSSSS